MMPCTETISVLKNRRGLSFDGKESKTTEEKLVEKLDIFLSSIESRLDSFEKYFQLQNEDLLLKDKSKESRRDSTTSTNTLKMFSLNNLNIIYQRLNVIKDSVLKTSVTNLEHLYYTLDDQYSYLFNSITSKEQPRSTQEVNTREVLSEKIMDIIQYFDDKLIQIDEYISAEKPDITNYNETAAQHLRFYNFHKALRAAQGTYLHYYQLPLSFRENKYIIYGYRFSLNHKTILKSLSHFNHNESMNIWTHLLGVMLFIYFGVWHYPNSSAYKNGTRSDLYVMYIFIGAAIKCLVSSVLWHTYSCCANLPLRSTFACVDYTGITVLITCSVIAAEYCSLYNYPKLLTTYISFSSICGMTSFIFNWSPYFDRPECRSLRIGFFMGLAFMGVTAFFCMCFNEGFLYALMFFFPLTYKSFMWYWIGVVFYGNLVPERWRSDVIIEEEDHCSHTHTSSDVLTGNIDNSGEEEMENIKEEIEEADNSTPQNFHTRQVEEILDKHFPSKPLKTPTCNNFSSLWWVDYCFSSHNIWHIFVVFGAAGHYFSILGMLEKISR